MRTRKSLPLLLLLAAMLAITPSVLLAQSKKEKKEQKKEAVNRLLASKNYTIDVDMALPMRGRSVPLTSSYSLTVRNDSVISYLPYYGRAYSIPYGGGEGLNFRAPLTAYEMNTDKKGRAVINFSARTLEDFYEFSAMVYSNGAASINVSMQNRQSISFNGELDTEKE